MYRIIDLLVKKHIALFGRCTYCMRSAFRWALAAWLLAGLALVANFGSVAFWVALAALALSLLTLAHIGVFSLRHASAMYRREKGELVRLGAHGVLPVPRKDRQSPVVTRRKMIGLVAKYAGVAAAAAVGLPHRAEASCGDCASIYGAGYYDCITHFCNNVGQYCCPPGFPYLNHCDCGCYDVTSFDCNSYSNCLYCG